jgi:metallo-beta-lactamase family protein
MQIEFQGAARTVTGSMHILHVDGARILLDCGLFQGRRAESNDRNRNFPFDPASIDAVVLSHAHIDHSGNLPQLVKKGFTGPIYATPATRDLCAIMLADSGFIQEKDAEFLNKKLAKRGEPPIEPIYGPRDVAATMKLFRTVAYDTPFDVRPNVTVRYSDAGHILGSASLHITVKEKGTTKTIGFTGDIGPKNLPIVRDPVFLGQVEALISESTYGGTPHTSTGEKEELLRSDLQRTIDRGGKVIVPAFSIGRTQDLVFALHKLFDAGKLPRVRIYVDSPLAVNATEVFKMHPECFDSETYAHVLANHDPFGFNQLHYVRDVAESKKINDRTEPCMIIAASGMCEAGRILHHLANNIADKRNTVLIVGFQAEHTLGRKLVNKEREVNIFGSPYELNAEVVVHDSFSAHADGNDLLGYVGQCDRRQLQQVFLVHGEYERQLAFQKGLKDRGYDRVEIPERGRVVPF